MKRSTSRPCAALPAERYQYGDWATARVNIDYHVDVDSHFYSVPYRLVHEPVEVRLSASTVEIFHKGVRVASHARSRAANKASTLDEHRPKSHQRYLQWTPSRLVEWGRKIGPLPPNCWSASSPPSPIRSRDSAPAWASSASATSTATSGWKPSPSGPCGQLVLLQEHRIHAEVQSRHSARAEAQPPRPPLDHANIRGPKYFDPPPPNPPFSEDSSCSTNRQSTNSAPCACAAWPRPCNSKQEPDIHQLSFEERLGLLIDRQWDWRQNRALERRLRNARLQGPACVEDIDYRTPRGLDRAVVRSLTQQSAWVAAHQNIFLVGPTGIGKTWLARAFGQKACRDGYSALFLKAAELFRDLAASRADGSHSKHLYHLGHVDVLIVDDWAMAPLTEAERRDFLQDFGAREK